MSHIDIVAELENCAHECRALASFIGAGLTPSQARQHCPRHGTSQPARELEAVWAYCLDVGAPLAATMTARADALEQLGRIYRSARSQSAGPKAASKLILSLPVVSIVLAALAGYNALPLLFGTGLGWILLGLGGGLLWLGHRWTARLISRAEQVESGAGLYAELLSLGLAAGLALDRAVEGAWNVCATVGGDYSDEQSQCRTVHAVAEETGASLVGLIRAVAGVRRDQLHERVRERMEKLAVSLTVPLGLCVLPAFICVGIVPIVMSILSSTTTVSPG